MGGSMKAVMELINTAVVILDRANKLIYDHENKVEMIYGFPIHYCPDELLKKFIKAHENLKLKAYLICYLILHKLDFKCILLQYIYLKDSPSLTSAPLLYLIFIILLSILQK